jgi:hypothetical protein
VHRHEQPTLCLDPKALVPGGRSTPLRDVKRRILRPGDRP